VIPVRSMRYRIRKHRYFTEQGKKKGWPGLTCGKYEVLNKKQQVGELPQAFTFKPDGSLTSQQVVRWQGNSAACLDRSLDIGMTITRHSSSHLAESLIMMKWMSKSKGFSANPFFNQQTPCSRIPVASMLHEHKQGLSRQPDLDYFKKIFSFSKHYGLPCTTCCRRTPPLSLQ
jgi:hypothetical protein